MKQFLSGITRNQAAFYICALFMIALIYSKFLLSQCMIALVVISLFQFDFSKKFPIVWNPQLKANFKRLYEDKSLLAITLFFFLTLLGSFYSTDAEYTLERLRLKLPFLFLPIAFIGIPSFSRRQYYSLLYFFIIITLVAALHVLINYLVHFDEFNMRLGMGQPLETPMNHIRFSLVLAFAIISNIILIKANFYWRKPYERYIQLGILVFLLCFIHILSVRSGLIALYLSFVFLSGRYIYITKRWSVGIATMLVILAVPLVAYQIIPSFRMRVDYAKYDWHMNKQGTGDQYSDSDRIKSVLIGLQIGNERPWFGVGSGNLKKEVERRYATEYPMSSEAKMPHNQLVSIYAGTGLLGLALFLIAFFVPIFQKKHYCNPLFMSLHIIVFFSFMSESTIENAIGTAFYLFFLLLCLNYIDRKSTLLSK